MQDTEEVPPDGVPRADDSDDAPDRRRPFVTVDCLIFGYVERGEISPTAGFLYLALLRHYNPKRQDKRVWPSRETLAKALDLSRPESVDPHLKALRDAGLISWESWRIGGMRARNRYTLHLIADTKSDETATPPVPLKTAQRTPLQRASDTPWTEDELELEEPPEDELDPTKLKNSAASPPFASLTPATAPQNSKNNFDDPWAEYDRNGRRSADLANEDYRKNDRELFKSYVGEAIRTDGSRWGADGEVYTAEAFYNSYRKRKSNKLRWPGKFLEKLEEDGRDITDWMIDEGLETA